MITLNLIDLILYTLIIMVGVYIIVEWRLRQTLHKTQDVEKKIRSVLKIMIDEIFSSIEVINDRIDEHEEKLNDNGENSEDN